MFLTSTRRRITILTLLVIEKNLFLISLTDEWLRLRKISEHGGQEEQEKEEAVVQHFHNLFRYEYYFTNSKQC